MPQSYVSLNYHLVFSTKDRLRLLTPELRPRIYDYLGGILHNQGGALLLAGGTDDHVHLLAAISKERSIAESLRTLKSNSSGWAKEKLAGMSQFAWQVGYAAFTIGRTEIAAVTRYIERQEEHHRTLSFQEELVDLLRRYGVEYDERYLWA